MSAWPTRRRLVVAVAAQQSAELVGMPEARIPLAHATVYIATAPKSNRAYMAVEKASARTCARVSRCPCRSILRGTGYQGAKRLGHGVDYQYSHDHEDAYVPQAYLPEGRRYYEPSDRGHENVSPNVWHTGAHCTNKEPGREVKPPQAGPVHSWRIAGSSKRSKLCATSRLVRKKEQHLFHRQQADVHQPRICRDRKTRFRLRTATWSIRLKKRLPTNEGDKHRAQVPRKIFQPITHCRARISGPGPAVEVDEIVPLHSGSPLNGSCRHR